MGLYLAAAVMASALLAAGLVVMKSRSAALPVASGSATAHAIWTWLRDPRWIGGVGIQLLGYLVYVGALSGAPISIVAVMMQGGIAMFVVFAVVILGERASAREWIGIGAIIAAMVLLSGSLWTGAPRDSMSAWSLLWLCALLLGMGLSPQVSRRLRSNGTAAAILSGVAFGLGGLFTKAMTMDFAAHQSLALGVRIISTPYSYLATAANLSGLVLLQNSFHAARGIVALPISSAISNLVPIAGGLLAFGESLPADPIAAALRIASFGLTIAAGALLAGAQSKPDATVTAAAVST